MYFSAHPGALGAALVTSAVDGGLGGGATAGGDGAAGPFESGGGIGDAGSAAWASKTPAIERASRLSSAAAAVRERTISPIEAAIFQQVFPIPSSSD
jgi:hypothetical protein